LIRSPGVFFTADFVKGKKTFGAKIIPNRGAWLEIETDFNGVLWVRVDRKRKIPVTSLLRIFGLKTDKEIKKAFEDMDAGEIDFIEETLMKDPVKNEMEAYKEVYKRFRPGDLATVENAKQMIDSVFFDHERYDFGKVGRYRLNFRLGMNKDEKSADNRLLGTDELVEIIKEIINLNNDPMAEPDDIDHLGSRRLRGIGELIQSRVRVGLMRMARNIKDKMSSCDVNNVVHAQLINSRPVVAAVKEFFSSSQLSQFMDQVNPLAELEHKRRLSAMGPGGLTRERAGFEVRDVHTSHYGRICPVQTPEGPNIGLVGHLACYAKINEYGFIETPYRVVGHNVKKTTNEKELIGRIVEESVKGKTGTALFKKGDIITKDNVSKISKSDRETIKVRPFITSQVEYVNAIVEGKKIIAHAGVVMDDHDNLVQDMVEARIKNEPSTIEAGKLDYVDVSPKQCISIATALIPFLEHDDSNRALMGSNMQRQAVSCIKPQSPYVGTGLEDKAAADSGQVVLAKEAGVIVEVDAKHIVVKEAKKIGK